MRADRNNQQLQNVEDPIRNITRQAERFAETRYPFSPFVIHFKKHINEKQVITELIKHVKDELKSDLEIAGYRKTTTNSQSDECNVLVFVESTASFETLFKREKWPNSLVNENYEVKIPTIPPQLSVVIQN
ncbi:unnamed protein product, partial [Didymodactylos carnosus]